MRNRWKVFFENMCISLDNSISSLGGGSISNDVNKNESSNKIKILIVTHGALLRQIHKYFVIDKSCEFNGDLEMRMPNTAISKIMVQLDADKRHLIKAKIEAFNESVASCAMTKCDI